MNSAYRNEEIYSAFGRNGAADCKNFMAVRKPYKAFKVRLRLFFLDLIGYRE